MTGSISAIATLALRFGIVAFITNEVRGLALAGPVLYAMYKAGGTYMAIWTGFCSLAGIALSVLVPILAARKVRQLYMPAAPNGEPLNA